MTKKCFLLLKIIVLFKITCTVALGLLFLFGNSLGIDKLYMLFIPFCIVSFKGIFYHVNFLIVVVLLWLLSTIVLVFAEKNIVTRIIFVSLATVTSVMDLVFSFTIRGLLIKSASIVFALLVFMVCIINIVMLFKSRKKKREDALAPENS